MFRTIHALVLIVGLMGFVGQGRAQDPVTERPGQAPQVRAPMAQKQAPAEAVKPIVTLEGREEGLISGPLVFHCYQGGKVVMIDATKKPVQGSFKAEGNRIQFIFGNCVYDGTEKQNILAGSARFTDGPNAGKTWNFSVAVRSLVGRTFAGKETLPGYGDLSFRFVDATAAEMTDRDGVTRGTYTQNGNQVTLTFGATTYTGDLRDGSIAGTARDPKNNWTFQVNASK